MTNNRLRREEIAARVEHAIERDDPVLGLRVAVSNTPYTASSTGKLARMLSEANVHDPGPVLDGQVIAELARWVVELGGVLDATSEEHSATANNYRRLLAQRDAMRSFLGTDRSVG